MKRSLAACFAVCAVFLAASACGSSDDSGSGGAVPVGAGCNNCVTAECPAAQACTDATCQSCLHDVTQAVCQSGTFASVASCACGSCAASCTTECSAYHGTKSGSPMYPATTSTGTAPAPSPSDD